jgi:hypothetical protein
MPPRRGGRAGAGARGKASAAAAQEAPSANEDGSGSSDGEYEPSPPKRRAVSRGKQPALDSRGKQPARDSEEDSEEDQPHQPSDEETAEEEGTAVSSMTLVQRIAASTQQVGDAARMTSYLQGIFFRHWGLSEEDAEPHVLLAAMIVGGLASFFPVLLPPHAPYSYQSTPKPSTPTFFKPSTPTFFPVPTLQTRTPQPYTPNPQPPTLTQGRLDVLTEFITSMSAAAHAKFMRGYRWIYNWETTGISATGALLSGVEPGLSTPPSVFLFHIQLTHVYAIRV